MSIAEKLTELDNKVDEVYEAGQKTEYDRFWDNYQQNGKQVTYMGAFYGYSWTDETFKPKYDIKPNNFTQDDIFKYSKITDIKSSLETCGVSLIFGNDCRRAANAFQGSITRRLPELNFSSLTTSTAYLFQGCTNLESIDKIICPTSEFNWTAYAFAGCSSLKEIRFEGIIDQNISFERSPLSIESIRSIIFALKDFGSTSTSKSLTLKSSAAANMTVEDRQTIIDKGWTLVEY